MAIFASVLLTFPLYGIVGLVVCLTQRGTTSQLPRAEMCCDRSTLLRASAIS